MHSSCGKQIRHTAQIWTASAHPYCIEIRDQAHACMPRASIVPEALQLLIERMGDAGTFCWYVLYVVAGLLRLSPGH